MYTPGLFEMNSLPEKHALIQANPFALLITQHEGEQHLSHSPFRLDPARGPLGTLEAHAAEQNAHGQAILKGAKSSVVFSGAHAYISPRWYADPTSASSAPRRWLLLSLPTNASRPAAW